MTEKEIAEAFAEAIRFQNFQLLRNCGESFEQIEKKIQEKRLHDEELIRAYERGKSIGKEIGIKKFALKLKETFNSEFPRNYHSTQPFFTLDNVKLIIEEVMEEQNK